jgi:XTP/dITP diphosphohydrolase
MHYMPDLIDPDHLLVLASGNAGKLKEVSSMLTPLGWTVRSQRDWKINEAVEDGLSFIENALIKARHAARHTGLKALGDDSGLLVDALSGMPGIYSSRFAGADADDKANNQKLLHDLRGVPAPERAAHFYCAMVLVRHADDPAPLISTGKWTGRIMEQHRGEGGFGYDPLFRVPRNECSSAELPPEVKNSLSHRGQALTALIAQMKDEFRN